MNHQADKAGPKPSVPYSHLYVDEEGISHQSSCALTDYALKGVGPADPQWNDKMQRSEATVVFTVQPVGWVGDWHKIRAAMDRRALRPLVDRKHGRRAHRAGAG